MHFSIRFIVLSVIILSLVAQRYANVPRNVEGEVCPTFCHCDLFVGLNRANCSGRRLISSNIEVPSSVEILDLSDNDITILDNNCFQAFIFLRNLTISHNAIHTIYFDTFSPLRSITSIDLSYNRLEYMDERIFETNRKLERLNLSDNKFMSLRNKPLLRSVSLRSLNLRNAQISHIYPELFNALPNLRELDVSANVMIALNMVAFRSLKRLEYLNLNANRWNCDTALLNAMKLLQKRGIQVELIDCNMVIRGAGGAGAAATIRKEVSTKSETMATTLTTKKNERFERLRMLDDDVPNENFNNLPAGSMEVNGKREPAKDDTSAENIGINIANVWHHTSLDDIYGDEDDQDDAEPNSYEVQSHKVKCETSCDELCFQYKLCLLDKVNVEKSIAGTYTINDLNFVFVMGIALGITFIVCIVSCVMCAKRCCEARKKHDTTAEYHITENAVAHIARPLPPQTAAPLIPPRSRISRRRRHQAPDPDNAANQTNALVCRDYATSQGRDNFLSRLFGRPARHQYYRTINHNTATLIRRLSRSNLFNNRLSQHFAAEGREQHDRAATATDTTQAQTAPSSPGSEDERFYDDVFYGTETPVTPEQPAVIEYHNRPETPPPSYGDVVVNVRK